MNSIKYSVLEMRCQGEIEVKTGVWGMVCETRRAENCGATWLVGNKADPRLAGEQGRGHLPSTVCRPPHG